MLAATVFRIFLIPAIFYLVEKWSGAGKEHGLAGAPGTTCSGAGRLR